MRRQFMGRVVDLLGGGGQSFAEQVLGWNRGTIRKGQAECRNDQAIKDRFQARGRRRAEAHAPIPLATANGNSDEEIFRAIAENADDLIAVLDTDGRRIYNSPSYHKIFRKEELRVGALA